MDIARLFRIFFLILLIPVFTSAQEVANRQIDDLTFRLLSVQSKNDVSLATDLNNLQVIGLFVTEAEPFKYLEICNQQPFNVWIEDQMHFEQKDCWRISRNELFEISPNDSVFISLQTAGSFNTIKAGTYGNVTANPTIINQILPRGSDYSSNLVIIFFLSVLAVFGVVKNEYRRSFFGILGGSLRINPRIEQEEIDFGSIVLILFTSLLISFAYWYIQVYSSAFYIDNLPMNLIQVGRFLIITLIAFAAKFIFIRIIAQLNGFRNIAWEQLIEFVRYSSVLASILIIIVLVKFWGGDLDSRASGWFWQFYFVAAYIGFIIYYYFKLGVNSNYRKLHIISYLCTTEILGATIIALIFTK